MEMVGCYNSGYNGQKKARARAGQAGKLYDLDWELQVDIRKNVDGWEIKPHTSTEEKALAFFLDALRTYAVAQEASGEEQVFQQDLIEIPAGTLIKIDGLPFTLAEPVKMHGSKENLKLIRQGKLPTADQATKEDCLAFTVWYPGTGKEYKVYANGDIEGFEPGACIFNDIRSLIRREVALERERVLKEVAGKQEIRALIADGFRLSSRDHLQMLRAIASNHADEPLNPDWKSAYRALSEAADRLDAMIARCEDNDAASCPSVLPLPG